MKSDLQVMVNWSIPTLFVLLLLLGGTAFSQDAACTTCHRDYTAGPIHAAADAECTGCHGDAREHLTNPTGGGIIGFEAESAKIRSDSCLSCHTGAHPHENSAHAAAGIACNDCHTIHVVTDTSGTETKPSWMVSLGSGSQSCAECHEDVFAAFNFSERHRLRENVLSCISCHDPHGPGMRNRLGGTRNEPCADCHAAQDGPFVFEHAASRVEGCTACHDAHGSPNRHLLAFQQVGELCYSCHAVVPQFHLGFAPVGAPRFGSDTVCTNCHVTIHGSHVDRNFLR